MNIRLSFHEVYQQSTCSFRQLGHTIAQYMCLCISYELYTISVDRLWLICDLPLQGYSTYYTRNILLILAT